MPENKQALELLPNEQEGSVDIELLTIDTHNEKNSDIYSPENSQHLVPHELESNLSNTLVLNHNHFKRQIFFLKLAILSIYPLAVFIGSLIQFFDLASPSYFSNKRNIINVYVVKKGWLWVTFLIICHYFTVYLRKPLHRFVALRNIFIRYVVATAWWIFFAQWFFGFPLMDKVFILTGGSCTEISSEKYSSNEVSSAQCRVLKGKWTGGHDPSGHTFLLTHASLYLWIELLPYIKRYLRVGSLITFENTKESPETDSTAASIMGSLFMTVTSAFLVIFWWMLLMTSVYFHTFAEKVTGLLWTYTGISIFFILVSSPYNEHF